MKFSVVVPVYNADAYLKQCIDSVLMQTFTDFELILADDASPDQSCKIIEEYDDPRIVFKKNTTGTPYGIGKNRNRAMRMAKGEYLLFLDCDDYFLDDNAFAYLNEWCDGTDIVIFDFVWGIYGPMKINLTQLQGYPAVWYKAWRREIVEDISFADVKLGEDIPFDQEARAAAKTMALHQVPLLYYNNPREGSVMDKHKKGIL